MHLTLGPLVWTILAVYGCAVQSFNLRWAFYKRRVIHSRTLPNDDQIVVARAHVRINMLRAAVVTFNLLIGVAFLVAHQPPSPTTLVGAFAAVGFIVNEIAWNTIITVEILERRKLHATSAE